MYGRNGSEAGGVSEAVTGLTKLDIEELRPGELVVLARPDFLLHCFYGWGMYEALPHQANDQVHVDVDGLIVELAGLEVGLLDRFHDPCIPVGAY